MADATRPARRCLHVCYCCADVEAPVALLVDGLGLRETMRTNGEPASGAILGMDYDVQNVAAFVYDARGPRVSPAVEVQSWIDPVLEGAPVADASQVGLRAVGFGVGGLDRTLVNLDAHGASVVTKGHSPIFDAPSATVVDPRGFAIDVVERPELTDSESRVHHLRITCTDLSRSIEWYHGLGFELVGRPVAVTDGATVGHLGRVEVTAQRLQLPDEPLELVLAEWREPVAVGQHYDRPNHAGWYRFALGVDDTRASYDAMVAQGWKFDRPPMLVALDGTPVPDMWITFTSDPDGVPVELVQRPRDAFR